MRKLFFLMSLVAAFNFANTQVIKKLPVDSLTRKPVKIPVTRTGPVVPKTDIVPEITGKLDSLLDRYKTFPDDAGTWKQVKTEAENILYTYWKNGKLPGTNATEAYYVKMDNTTMTSNDILNHMMVLVAGIAPVKPAEFEIIRITKTGKSN